MNQIANNPSTIKASVDDKYPSQNVELPLVKEDLVIDTNKVFYSATSPINISTTIVAAAVLISNDSNPICQILFPSLIVFQAHHKTGVILSGKLHKSICEYCGLQTCESENTNTLKLRSYNKNNTFFHFWRDPVLTIVSGFNYHKHCHEVFVTHTLSTHSLNASAAFLSNNSANVLNVSMATLLYNRLIKNGTEYIQQNKLIKIRDIYLYYLNDALNQINLYHYGNYFGFNIDFDDRWIHEKYNIFRGSDAKKQSNFDKYSTITKWYQSFVNTTVKYGLYFEMIRYLFWIYPPTYHIHNAVATKHKFGGYELKMEDWINNFNSNLNIMLDGLNLIDSVQNRNILKKYKFSHIDIENERKHLTKQLQVHDPKRAQYGDHIHIARNDTKYYDELLSLDPNLCLLLKHITNRIHYGWSYSAYC